MAAKYHQTKRQCGISRFSAAMKAVCLTAATAAAASGESFAEPRHETHASFPAQASASEIEFIALLDQAAWLSESSGTPETLADAIILPSSHLQEGADPAPEGERDNLASGNTQLGQAPPDRELVFLRRQVVLLAPGESQFDIGMTYSYFNDELPIAVTNGGGTVVAVGEARTRQRVVAVPMEIRYGWSPGVQLFANMPVGYSNSEFAFNGFKQTEDDGGAGDLRAGSSVVLKYGQQGSPDVILTTGFTAPTGSGSFITGGFTPNSQLGEGFWALNANLLVVHTYDPCIVFYGAGYNHRFDDRQQGILVNPGEEINYQLGVGFAVNSRVTLSSSMQGAYLTEAELNGDRIEGSTLEPMRMRMAVTLTKECHIVEPFADIPMTEDAAARFGVIWTF